MNIRRKYLERIIITGQQEEASKAFDYCEKNDFWVIQSGPMPIAKHRVDANRFRIVAEREIEKEGLCTNT